MINCLTLLVLGITLFYLFNIKEVKSPLFIFSFVWFVIIFLYNIRLFGIYEIQSNTSIVLLCGVCLYILGYLLTDKLNVKKDSGLTSDRQYIRVKILSLVTLIVSLPFYIPNIIKVFQGISSNTIKMGMVTGEITLGGVAMQYFVRPIEYIVIAICAYCIFMNRKQIIIIATGILLTFFEFIGVGSKTIFVYFIACIGITYFMNSDILSHIKKYKKIVIICSIFLPCFLITNVGLSSLYYYICGCIPMLDKIINTDFYISNGFTYGFLSFNSVVRLVINLLSIFGINFESKLFNLANTYFSRFEYTTQIADNVNYNAFHTLFGDFFVDGAWISVIILSFLFGSFSCYIYKKYKKSKSLWSHSVYCILIYYIFRINVDLLFFIFKTYSFYWKDKIQD